MTVLKGKKDVSEKEKLTENHIFYLKTIEKTSFIRPVEKPPKVINGNYPLLHTPETKKER